jgi:hypothetical protein
MQEHRLAAGASDIVDHGLAAGIIQVGNHYLGAFTRQCCRTCCADARCAAGDDRDLAVYLHHLAPSLFRCLHSEANGIEIGPAIAAIGN